MTLRLLLTTLLLSASLLRAQQDPAIATDPTPDKANPAHTETFQIPSHGALLNALMYVAPGATPHPVVLLLHGFPGNERNLDLAQSIRRAGWDVLYFNYRGAWGSPGEFSFAHAIEDTQAAIAWLRDPANARKLHADPATLVLIGHSMGGMIAANVAAQDPAIRAVGLISAANMAGRTLPAVQAHQEAAALPGIASSLAAEGLAPLSACPTPACLQTLSTTLAKELLSNAARWNLPDLAPKLASRPMLIVTSDDGLADAANALTDNLRKLGDSEVSAVHLPTDHVYSDHRIALQQTVLEGLNYLTKQ